MHRRESLRALFALPLTAHGGWRGAETAPIATLDWVDVRSTGASGTGQSDDSGAIQRAFDKVSLGGTVYVPAGRYRIDQPLSPRFKSKYKNGVQVCLRLDPGAILIGAIVDKQAAVLDCRENVGQDGSFRIDGGIIEGVAGRAGTGVRIATQNVAMDSTLVRGFDRSGVDFAKDGGAPAIRTSLHRVALLFNRVGLRCTESASGLVVDKCWIEGSAEEGVIVHGAGHVSIIGSVIENSGFERRNAAQLLVQGSGTTSVNVIASYFESFPDQAHSHVVVDGIESAVKVFLFTGNRVTGYPVEGSAGVTIGARGGVDTVTVTGNTFAGSKVGVSIGRFTHDYHIAGNAWSDHFATAGNDRIRIDAHQREFQRGLGIGDIDESTSNSRRIRRVATDASVGPSDATLLCDASARALTVSLRSAVNAEHIVVVKKVDSSVHPVRIAPTAGQKVEQGAVLELTRPGSSVTLQSDGTEWWSVGAS